LYDHVPPPTGVPNPGYSPTLLRRFLRTIYHRKAAAFDFSMLGPRVPAVLISPYVEAGTVSTDVHDHASVPATLRALFAPAARPLTARDAWARPFHQLAARDTPRANLPDFSHALPTAVPPPQAGTRWPALGGSLPRQLAARGAPEAAPAPGLPALERARQATVAFSAEAYRSRQHRGRP
jgi:phospholipase C